MTLTMQTITRRMFIYTVVSRVGRVHANPPEIASRAFSDLPVKRSAIAPLYILCNNGRRGVVDTSLGYDCLEWSKLSYWHRAISLCLFIYFLYFTLEFLYQLWLKNYLFLLFVFFYTQLQKKKKNKRLNGRYCICCSYTIIKDPESWFLLYLPEV